MSFIDLFFLFVFLPFLVFSYYMLSGPFKNLRNWLLLFFSILFYLIACPSLFPVLLVSVFVNHLLVTCESKFHKTLFGNIAITLNVALLCFFKYVNSIFPPVSLFFSDQAILTSFVMPLGISYYTFNAISLILDCRKNNLVPTFLETALHIGFFPKIVSGPVVPFKDICLDLRNRRESVLMFCCGWERICTGLIKKVLIADPLAEIVGYYFGGGTVSMTGAWIGSLAFSLQLFFDFSAFTDLAIGIGNLFGFRFMENFNYPYAATSVSNFWRRWHISLTKWFTNYLYIPLGGNQVSKPRHILNIAIVWVCTGLWHGSSITFLIWAGIQFVCLIIEKYTNLKNYVEKHTYIGHVYVLLIALVSWTAFRAGTVQAFVKHTTSLFGFHTVPYQAEDLVILKSSSLLLLIACVFCLPVKNTLLTCFPKNRKTVSFLWNFISIVLFVFAISIRIISGNKGVLSLYANF